MKDPWDDFRIRYFMLDGKTPVAAESAQQWADWRSDADHVVKQTHFEGAMVSTIFTGIPFEYAGLMFETMVFGTATHDLEQRRYNTWDEAAAGHDAIVAELLSLGETLRPDPEGDA